MRAFWGKWCPVSHVTFEAPLRTSHSTLHTSHSTLHTSHCTLRTRHFTLHTPHFTVHTSRFSLPFFTLHTSHLTLHTSHFTLHTALFTPHTSHCTLHTPHFISSELFSYLPSSSLLISSLLICHRRFHESLPQYYFENLHAPCASQARACVLCTKLLQCCCPRTWPARDKGCNARQANTFLTLHSSHHTLHTSHLHFISTHLI